MPGESAKHRRHGGGGVELMGPPELLRLKLHDARCFGFPFAGAWLHASRSAAGIAEHPGEWLAVFEATEDAWRRAYERVDATEVDAALGVLGEGRELPDDDWGRRCCEQCGHWLAPDRDPRALYCGERCRRDASYRRERQLAVVGRTGGSKCLASVAPLFDAVKECE
jgi:hypothetical protein